MSDPRFLVTWLASSAASLAVVALDLQSRNRGLGNTMKLVWLLTVLYSGPLGLLVYWSSGRRQISDDALWRRGLRSTAHCYSGCGLGEMLGVTISVGAFAAGAWVTAVITFLMAYAMGLAFTIKPLMDDGVSFPRALRDGVWSESASIVVMEAVAILVDLSLAGDAGLDTIQFWTSLIVSLSVGFIAAYPVNLALIHLGVKRGMHDPRNQPLPA